MTCSRQPCPRQHGAALATALCLMLAVMTIGVCAARTALGAEKSARLERDRHIALLAADAALADAESDIDGGANPSSTRAAVLAGGSAASFVPGCGRASANLGLCAPSSPSNPPAWQAADLAGDAAVPYGRFTGAVMPAGSGLLPARVPRYVIELVPFGAPGALYRITAIGFGTRASTVAVVQSYYRKAPTGGAAGTPGLPEKRIGWREVANWPELHKAAIRTRT
jgi:Tfp pilus assembly protein PilX